MDIESIMEICANALSDAGYIIKEFQADYENFTVSDGDEFVEVEFKEVR